MKQLFIVLLLCPFVANAQVSSVDWYAMSGVKSAHVTEGRNNFDSPIAEIGFGMNLKGFAIDVWSAKATNNQSWETGFTLGYTFNLFEVLKWTPQYYRFDQNAKGERDASDEIINNFSISPSRYLDVTARHIYVPKNNSQYLLVGINGKFRLANDCQWVFSPYAKQEIDHGYSRAGFSGLNNIRFGAELSRPVTTNLNVSFDLNYSIAQKGVLLDKGRDQLWGGAYLSLSF
ncbi:hypothetical protein [Paraferrimonas sedimenticola]|uniref:Outer membrane protein beta-barrel domain-containing protein n=1 Tax=Paraferrimonas sedimenticola TaxID=375674 RepID=A0AA37RYD0_9GAMM|nr:hypothetical protein [Paraferrimonas sedimenticola]GLP97620.1 hypothetical protein GCM10007895_29270 [Paraferrimonas sedimenticola]